MVKKPPDSLTVINPGKQYLMLVETKPKSIPTIILCDDDEMIHLALKTVLKNRARTLSAKTIEQLTLFLKKEEVDLVILDVSLNGQDEGIQALSQIKENTPQIPVIILSGKTEVYTIREALRRGAEDYLFKSELSDLDLTHKLENILRTKTLQQRNLQLSKECESQLKEFQIIGKSPAIQALQFKISKYKNYSDNVLIIGETGTGKELVAKNLRTHYQDGTLRPFVCVDSATITDSMAESLLFGFEKGAFTGADRAHVGLLEEADNGTLYFDEIANMPMQIQIKLLRALQEKEIRRLGGSRTKKLNFRVVAATNVDLEAEVRTGRFRADLFQRLNVLPLTVPPLRERPEDIPLLIQHFLQKKAAEYREQSLGSVPPIFSNEAMQLLINYNWPGNVRELINTVSYSFIHSAGAVIQSGDLPKRISQSSFNQDCDNLFDANNANLGEDNSLLCGTRAAEETSDLEKEETIFSEILPSTGPLKIQIGNYERALLKRYHQYFQGNLSKMARTLEIDRSHLRSKLRKLKVIQ